MYTFRLFYIHASFKHDESFYNSSETLETSETFQLFLNNHYHNKVAHHV